MEDNSAACRVVITGRNPSMRHMSRTQRIDIAWLNERYSEKAFRFIECPSEFQAGDIMTKHFTDVKVWERNLNLICHFEDEVFAKAFTRTAGCAIEQDPGIEVKVEVNEEVQALEPAPVAASVNAVPNRFIKYVIAPLRYDYTLILFCSYHDSILADTRLSKGCCRTIIINDEIDARSYKAMELIRFVSYNSEGRVALWASLPCTGGCTWNFINARTPEGRARIRAHIALMVQLLEKFIVAARIVIKAKGFVFFEWPRRCTYWKRTDVIDMVQTLGITPTRFDGCALGLRSKTKGREHMFLMKPWVVMHNSKHFSKIFTPFCCPGSSRIHLHDQCRGINAKMSERYTDVFALNVHKTLRMDFEC